MSLTGYTSCTQNRWSTIYSSLFSTIYTYCTHKVFRYTHKVFRPRGGCTHNIVVYIVGALVYLSRVSILCIYCGCTGIYCGYTLWMYILWVSIYCGLQVYVVGMYCGCILSMCCSCIYCGCVYVVGDSHPQYIRTAPTIHCQ